MASPTQRIDERFRLAIEAAPCAMVLVNHEGKITLANAQTERIFGYSSDELVGQSIEILVPDSLHEAHQDLSRSFVQQARTRLAALDVRGRRKDGSLFSVEIGLTAIQTPEGTWVLSSIEDVSERERTQARLRESEERFRNLADTSPMLIWMSGPDKLCTFFNKGWLEFTGRTLEQEMGNGWAEGIHSEDMERCLTIYETSFDNRKEFQMEYRLRRKDGEYRWVLDSGVPRFGPGDAFTGYVGSCTDISDLKQAQEVTIAKHMLQSLGVLARGLAHDFSNMQSGIIFLSEVILESPVLDSSLAEEVREIRKIAMHGSEIVHELMVYAKGQDDAVEQVDISMLVEEMREILRLSIPKYLLVQTHLDADGSSVLANPSHIRQILMTLVVNASEAISEKGAVIDISTSLVKAALPSGRPTSPQSNCLRLAVSHTRNKMMSNSPFRSARKAAPGLDLPAVEAIIIRYGGVLNVIGSPSEGMRFEVLFPCEHQSAA
jgi:two-component system, cell cycle sensor histidine kinase and response regulator CckA